MYCVLLNPTENLALVTDLRDTKLPYGAVIIPMPIECAVATALINYYEASDWGDGIKEEMLVVSPNSVGFNTCITYERATIPRGVTKTKDDGDDAVKEFTVIHLSDKANVGYRILFHRNYVAFERSSDSWRRWFVVLPKFHRSIPAWMPLREIASFEHVYSEMVEW